MTASPTVSGVTRRLLELSWRHRATCVGVLAFHVTWLLMGLGSLRVGGAAIDLLRGALDPGAPPVHWPFGLALPAAWSDGELLLACGAAVLLMGVARVLADYGYTLTVGRLVHLQIVPQLRAQVFAKLQRLSLRFFDQYGSGSIINRVTADVQAVRSFVDGVLLHGTSLLLSLGINLAYMLRTHAGLTVACLAPTPLIWIAVALFTRWAGPTYDRTHRLAEAMLLALSEGIRGSRVTKIFGREAHELQRFQRKNRALLDSQDRIFKWLSRFGPAISLVTQLNVAILLFYGGLLVARRAISLGELVVFAGLLQQFASQIAAMAGVFNTLEGSKSAARRVFEVLDAPVEIESPPQPLRLSPARGAVTFDALTFGYHADKPVLHALDFAVEPGQCVAIFGANGAGKSTLLSLIPRFYDPLSGRVLVDGIDLRQLDLASLRQSIGLVFQESLLFRGTVAENIAFGHPEAGRAAIERAARTAGAHEFIGELPNGYDTALEEGGVNLSGGQRQRVAIARALVAEPSILLLDDPTAALDSETEDVVLAAVDRARQGRTTFIVANRASAVRRADLVLVLDEGRIIERGSPAELTAARGPYFRVTSLQVPDGPGAAPSPVLGEVMNS